MYPGYKPPKPKSPYLSFTSIATAMASTLGVISVIMFSLTSVFLILTVAFIILKVTALVTFGWGWVFAPIWMPILLIPNTVLATFIGCYTINGIIFVKRLCTGKIGK